MRDEYDFSKAKQNPYASKLKKQITINIDTETIEYFTKAGISIEYMYCFSDNTSGVVVIRPNNMEAAHEVIRRNSLNCLTESELCGL